MPFLMAKARTKNNAKEGMTNQNILIDKSEISVKSFVSSYKKIKAMIEINGSEAKIAPQKLLALEISEIRKMSSADATILIK